MYVKLSAGRAVTLEDPSNFRAFKLVVEGDAAGLDEARRALQGIAVLDDAAVAWISQEALRGRPEVQGDAAWRQGFNAMIENARPHGWIDDAGGTIKAHIEWVPPA